MTEKFHGPEVAHAAEDGRVPYLHSADPDAGSAGGWNECYTGTRFYTFDPRPADVRIDDIAHSLSLQCRYNGNCKRFYSVAEHSCLLADYVEHTPPWPRTGVPNDTNFAARARDALTALMHDAAEAYIGDLIRPVKHRMPEFKQLESLIEHCVFPVYGLDPVLPPWMKDLDSRILCDERRQVMLTQTNEWSTDQLKPLGVRIQFWPPARAEFEFRRRFNYLALDDPWTHARKRARRQTPGASRWWR